MLPPGGERGTLTVGHDGKNVRNAQIRRLGSGRSKIKSTASKFTSKVGGEGGESSWRGYASSGRFTDKR